MATRKLSCSFCGNEVEDYDEYCSECGESVVKDQEAAVDDDEDFALKPQEDDTEEETDDAL